jgi:aldehyde:ferredoxin oxidoreductase
MAFQADCAGFVLEVDLTARRPQKSQVMNILEPLKRGFYEAQGWDVETGIPTLNRLERLGLEDIAEDLEDRGIIKGKVVA